MKLDITFACGDLDFEANFRASVKRKLKCNELLESCKYNLFDITACKLMKQTNKKKSSFYHLVVGVLNSS